MGVEGGLEGFGDLLGVAAFDLVAVEHPHHFAVLEQGGRGAAGGEAGEVLAGAANGLGINPGEHGADAVGLGAVGGHHRAQAWAGTTGRAAADRVDEHQAGARLLNKGINTLSSGQIFNAVVGEFGTHRRGHFGRVHGGILRVGRCR